VRNQADDRSKRNVRPTTDFPFVADTFKDQMDTTTNDKCSQAYAEKKAYQVEAYKSECIGL
jgi:hypothetical protein